LSPRAGLIISWIFFKVYRTPCFWFFPPAASLCSGKQKKFPVAISIYLSPSSSSCKPSAPSAAAPERRRQPHLCSSLPHLCSSPSQAPSTMAPSRPLSTHRLVLLLQHARSSAQLLLAGVPFYARRSSSPTPSHLLLSPLRVLCRVLHDALGFQLARAPFPAVSSPQRRARL
jgi:hypothetical protein